MNICILGHFGHGQNLLNGQTVKTKNLSDGIKNKENQHGTENRIHLG